MQAAFFQFSLNFCSYPQYITWGGGGQANFTGKCINFLNGAAFPARNGAAAHCAGAASAAGERPAGRFSSVSPPAGTRPFTAPAPRAAGAPPRRKPAPPARAEQGARGGRGRSAPTRARRNSRGSTAPQGSTGHARGQRISEGSRRGGGARRPPSGRPFNAAPSSNGGSGGAPMWGAPPRATRLPSDGLGGTRSESRNHRHRPAASERAAQRARAPPTRRIRLRRGFVEGSCCSIRCAAAWRPVVHALPRILLRVIPGW